MRELVTIQRIQNIRPIDGADAICLANVLGWQIVIKKDEFKDGDLCVFFEIDSLLPKEDARFSFMEKSKYRVRTMRLRGAVSQGLALPITLWDNLPSEEGTNVTELIGVVKYDDTKIEVCNDRKPNQNIRRPARPFPETFPKTEQHRLESKPLLRDEIAKSEAIGTLKLDGCSVSFFYDEASQEVLAASRNVVLKRNDENYWNEQLKQAIEFFLLKNRHLVVQGEIVGPSIQKNPLNLKTRKFFLFDVYDIKQGKYLDWEEVNKIAEEIYVDVVPEVCRWKAGELPSAAGLKCAANALEYKTYFKESKHWAEGFVIRAAQEKYLQSCRWRSTVKVISVNFLLQQ